MPQFHAMLKQLLASESLTKAQLKKRLEEDEPITDQDIADMDYSIIADLCLENKKDLDNWLKWYVPVFIGIHGLEYLCNYFGCNDAETHGEIIEHILKMHDKKSTIKWVHHGINEVFTNSPSTSMLKIIWPEAISFTPEEQPESFNPMNLQLTEYHSQEYDTYRDLINNQDAYSHGEEVGAIPFGKIN